jgi:hypothetical protein
MLILAARARERLSSDCEDFFRRYDAFRYQREAHILRRLDAIDFKGKQLLEVGLGQEPTRSRLYACSPTARVLAQTVCACSRLASLGTLETTQVNNPIVSWPKYATIKEEQPLANHEYCRRPAEHDEGRPLAGGISTARGN